MIKVGILVDEMRAPAWIQRMLDIIVDAEGFEVSLIVLNLGGRNRDPRLSGSIRDSGPIIYSAWRTIDRVLFKAQPDAFVITDLKVLFPAVDTINVTPELEGAVEYCSLADTSTIATYAIDVFLQFSSLEFRAWGPQVASCGIWSYHSSSKDYLAGHPGSWAVLSNAGVIESSLRIHGGGDSCNGILFRSWSCADLFSSNRSLNGSYWRALLFVPRKLEELKRIGRHEFRKKYLDEKSTSRVSPDATFPDRGRCVKLLFALLSKKVGELISRSYSRYQWELLYNFGISDFPVKVTKFKTLSPPHDRFWADPCVIEYRGEHVIFLEELKYSDNKGFLSVIKFDATGNPILPPLPILNKEHHLSYPFVFEDNGDLFMIPESMQNKTIELYRCVDFPNEWEFVMNLMTDILAVDATLYRRDGKYWIFANVVQSFGSSPNDELFLFSSDTLFSESWRSHPCNPIVSDVRCARPAGRIFQHAGEWYRPAQDCSFRYGRALLFQRIDWIDELDYRETTVSRIDPNWDPNIICTHTFSQMGRLTCLDVLRKRWKM